MKFLDTSFLVDYLRGREYALEYLEERPHEVFIASSVSFFELSRGELKSKGKNDIERLKEDLSWLKIQKLDQESAENAAKIEKNLEEEEKKVNLADVLIAGTAQKTGANLVTGDRDFDGIDQLEIEKPGAQK
ncbi:MAG: PIN domain-containing protein [Candidatus Nanohaloarchaea archaeon]